MRTAAIEVKSLTTGYATGHDVTVVSRDINAVIHGGELTCLLGTNGAGKSTLVRTLSAFQPPISGIIELMGRNLTDYSGKELSKLLSVVLTHKINLHNMSVEEVIGLGRTPYTGFWGTLNREDQKAVNSAIEMVGICELRDRNIDTLSDGERQKVMIAKALAQATPIIFLDEPTAFLDYPSKVEIIKLLHTLSRTTGKAIFLSTHDLDIALQIADVLWLLDRDKGVTIGTPEDLAHQGIITQLFERTGITFDISTRIFHIEK